MIKIFIEAQRDTTPEYNFISTLLNVLGIDKDVYKIEPLGGKDNLHNAKNQFLQNSLEGGINLIIFDADYEGNGGGFNRRKNELTDKITDLGIDARLFLWPNNCDDGDFERVLEDVARKDLHKRFFDCFGDYESCLGPDYQTPNRKGKFHTYITAMKLTAKQRNMIGKGQWLFDNPELWNMNSSALAPLKEFLVNSFKL